MLARALTVDGAVGQGLGGRQRRVGAQVRPIVQEQVVVLGRWGLWRGRRPCCCVGLQLMLPWILLRRSLLKAAASVEGA